jgi:hypothetical protein
MEYLILPLRRRSEDERGQENWLCRAGLYRIPFLLFGFAFLFREFLFLRGPSHGGINP